MSEWREDLKIETAGVNDRDAGREKIMRQAMVKATQRIADLFWTMASDEEGEVSHYRSPFYAGAKDLLIKAIEATYPGVDADRVYDIISESGESVADSVSYWRERDAQHEWCKIEYTDIVPGQMYCYTHGDTFMQ